VTRRPAIWLGDAIRVADALRADAETAARIRILLGLAPEPSTPWIGEVPEFPEGLSPSLSPSRPPDPPRTPEPHRPADWSDPADHVLPTVERLNTPRPTPPAALQPLSAVLEPAPPRLPIEPTDLFHHDRQRAVLTTLCSGPAPTGEPDLDAAVEIAARGEPLLVLPPEIRPTTRRGLQLLIDRGDAMLPFLRDQKRLQDAVSMLTGPDGLELVHFARTPLDSPGAGAGPLWTWRPYRPPLPGQPVLVLSDLGALAPVIERSDVDEAWCRFAALLGEAGCPVVALVPAPLRRLSPRVRSAVAVVPWDRPTGVRDAVDATRRAGGRLPRDPW
jgi:hypothetical protein